MRILLRNYEDSNKLEQPSILLKGVNKMIFEVLQNEFQVFQIRFPPTALHVTMGYEVFVYL